MARWAWRPRPAFTVFAAVVRVRRGPSTTRSRPTTTNRRRGWLRRRSTAVARLVRVVRDLSSPEAGPASLRVHYDGETRMVQLLDRGASNEEPLDLAFIEHVAKAGKLRVASTGWRLLFLMTTPTERTVTEVWFHRSVKLTNDPAAMLMSSPNLNRRVLAEHCLERLPLEASAVEIERPTLPARCAGMRKCMASCSRALRSGSAPRSTSLRAFNSMSPIPR